MNKRIAYAQLYLRMALGIGFLVLGLDRLGLWGPNGSSPNISWGDWQHFLISARQTMSFLPPSLADILALIATIGEIGFGLLLVVGLFTRLAATGSGLLTACFAISMFISFGPASPVNYSVFTVSAASFLLASIPTYSWSIDQLRLKHKTIK